MVDLGLQDPPLKSGWYGAHLGPKSVLFCIIFLHCFGRLQVGPRGAQEAPRPPQDGPKTLPRRPKRPPSAPRRSHEEPKRPQEPVKRVPDLPRSPLKAPKDTEDASDSEKHYPQDNCAYQCCRCRRVRQRQKTLHPRRSSDWPGGRRCSPMGEAIRRPDRRGGMNGVLDRRMQRE